nr:MAG TPA: hypothetical protein [Caudoviricetes sp.]
MALSLVNTQNSPLRVHVAGRIFQTELTKIVTVGVSQRILLL